MTPPGGSPTGTPGTPAAPVPPKEAPRRLGPGDPDLASVHALLHDSFAFMDGRIDPPSSIAALIPEALAAEAARAELWVIGAPPRACVLLSPRPPVLYLAKLATARQARGQGLARRLVDQAATRARALGLAALELQTRVELTENHAAFAALGFTETGRTAHPGHSRPTSVTLRRPLRDPWRGA